MKNPVGFNKQAIWNYTLLILVVYGFICVPMAAAGDLMSTICNNEVVSVGDRKGEVLAKCGKPLSNTKEAEQTEATQITRKKKSAKKQADKDKITAKKKTVKESANTWVYNIDGSYRYFIFKDGRLSRIETGGLAD